MARTGGPPDQSCFQPGATCPALDFDDKNYTKQLLTLELGYVF